MLMGEHSAAVGTFRWEIAPLPLTLGMVALVLFSQGFVRLRRRGRTDHASWSRAVLFALGLSLSLLPLVSPIDPIGDRYLLSVHMLEHVLLGDLGPALMVLSVRGPLAVFLLPPFLLRPVARSSRLRQVTNVILQPRVTLVIWVAVVWTWHIPPVYDFTLVHPNVHGLEHATFALVGVLVWVQLIDPLGHRRMTIPQRLWFALGIVVAGQILCDTLIFSWHSLYPSYADQPVRVLGIGPLLDQRLAGLVMMIEQTLTMGICALVLVRHHMRTAATRPTVGAVV